MCMCPGQAPITVSPSPLPPEVNHVPSRKKFRFLGTLGDPSQSVTAISDEHFALFFRTIAQIAFKKCKMVLICELPLIVGTRGMTRNSG